jgi:hypothetical protein
MLKVLPDLTEATIMKPDPENPPDPIQEKLDRREHPRIHYPIPLRVQGSDFAFDTIVDDLSAGGVRSRSFRKLWEGDKLLFMVDFSLAGSHAETKPVMSAQGFVKRVRDLQDGTFEFAAKFTQFHFL